MREWARGLCRSYGYLKFSAGPGTRCRRCAQPTARRAGRAGARVSRHCSDGAHVRATRFRRAGEGLARITWPSLRRRSARRSASWAPTASRRFPRCAARPAGSRCTRCSTRRCAARTGEAPAHDRAHHWPASKLGRCAHGRADRGVEGRHARHAAVEGPRSGLARAACAASRRTDAPTMAAIAGGFTGAVAYSKAATIARLNLRALTVSDLILVRPSGRPSGSR
jgi:hypothetical protein